MPRFFKTPPGGGLPVDLPTDERSCCGSRIFGPRKDGPFTAEKKVPFLSFFVLFGVGEVR